MDLFHLQAHSSQPLSQMLNQHSSKSTDIVVKYYFRSENQQFKKYSITTLKVSVLKFIQVKVTDTCFIKEFVDKTHFNS